MGAIQSCHLCHRLVVQFGTYQSLYRLLLEYGIGDTQSLGEILRHALDRGTMRLASLPRSSLKIKLLILDSLVVVFGVQLRPVLTVDLVYETFALTCTHRDNRFWNNILPFRR